MEAVELGLIRRMEMERWDVPVIDGNAAIASTEWKFGVPVAMARTYSAPSWTSEGT